MSPAALLPMLLLMAPDDSAGIMARSVEAARANREKLRGYAYREFYINEHADGEGKQTRARSLAWDVIGLEGATYRKLVEINGKPLPPKLAAREDRRLREEAERRRREGPERTRKRLQSSLSYTWNVDYTRLPDAYDFKLIGEEPVDGRGAYVLEGSANPAFQPRPEFDSDRDWKCFHLRLWVDKAEFLCLRMDIDVIGEGSRLRKGSWLRERFGKLNDEVWVSKQLQVGYAARFFKLLEASGLVTVTYSDFRKFQVDSKLSYE